MKDLFIVATLVGVAYLVYYQVQKEKGKKSCHCQKREDDDGGSGSGVVANTVQDAVNTAKNGLPRLSGMSNKASFLSMRSDFNASENATFAPAKNTIY
jgi:hypothetical protein